MFDVRCLRESGDSVVLTLTPDIIRKVELSAGDEVRIATDFDGTEITISATETEDDPDTTPDTVEA